MLFSFCLWPGTLCCGTAELSMLLPPFQNSLVVMALIWEGRGMCLHPLSSDKTSGPILYALIPAGSGQGHLQMLGLNQHCPNEFSMPHSMNEPSEIWVFKICLRHPWITPPTHIPHLGQF